MRNLTRLQDLLAKLNQVTWNKACGDAIEGVTTEDDTVKLSVTTELANNEHDFKRLPIQVIYRISVNGHYAMTWGSDSQEMNSQMVEYFVRTEAHAQREQNSLELSRGKRAEKIFDSL